MGELTEIRPVTADEYVEVEQKLAKLVETRQDLVLIQGEAALPLEAAARGLGRPGARALNVVTGPYGIVFGDWLRQAGAEVEDLIFEFDSAATADAVADALARSRGVQIVSIVHAEAATGSVNPLAEIAEVARAAGAIVVVDAVASLGADPLEIDDWGLDLTVLATQKALAGPTGASAVVVSPRAWEWLESNPAAPRSSALSLLDWKERWLDPGRQMLPVIPHHVETRLLGAILDCALQEGLAGVIARHAAARDACRRGLRVLALEPWIRLDSQATAVATTFRPPAGIAPTELLDAARQSHLGASALPLALAPEPLATKALRVSHTGWHATLIDVVAVLSAVGLGMRRLGLEADVGGAIEAALAQAVPSSPGSSGPTD